MVQVTRSRHISAEPATVFAVLADQERLDGLIPRVQRVELLERGPHHARIATHMAFGPFGSLRTEGHVTWQDGREIVFSARRPVEVEARWTLTPAEGGTEVQVAMALDLAPLIGPLSAFVPADRVRAMIAPDLEAALTEVARRLEIPR